MKNGHLHTCIFIRKEVMRNLEKLDMFNDCFKNIPDLAELINNTKRKKKIKK